VGHKGISKKRRRTEPKARYSGPTLRSAGGRDLGEKAKTNVRAGGGNIKLRKVWGKDGAGSNVKKLKVGNNMS